MLGKKNRTMNKKFITSPDDDITPFLVEPRVFYDEERKKYISTWGDLMEPNVFRIRGDMAEIQLTCGHWLGAYEEPILLHVKDYSRTGEKASSYGSYCKECAEMLEKNKLVLHNDKQIKKWIGLKE